MYRPERLTGTVTIPISTANKGKDWWPGQGRDNPTAHSSHHHTPDSTSPWKSRPDTAADRYELTCAGAHSRGVTRVSLGHPSLTSASTQAILVKFNKLHKIGVTVPKNSFSGSSLLDRTSGAVMVFSGSSFLIHPKSWMIHQKEKNWLDFSLEKRIYLTFLPETMWIKFFGIFILLQREWSGTLPCSIS